MAEKQEPKKTMSARTRKRLTHLEKKVDGPEKQEPFPELLQIQEILTLRFECEQETERPELLSIRTPFYLPDGTGIDLTLNLLTNVLSDEGETLNWLEQALVHADFRFYDAISWICQDSGLKRIRGSNHIHVEVNIPELLDFVLVLSLACMRVACLADSRTLEYKHMPQIKGSKLDLLRIRNEAEARRARKRRRTELEKHTTPDPPPGHEGRGKTGPKACY